MMTDNDNLGEQPATDESMTDRRTPLKATGTTIVGGAGLAAASGSASAQFLGGPEVIEVDDLFGWSADGSIPVADEVLVFIHGWFGDSTVESQTTDVQDSLESGGYTPCETVAIEWPGTTLNFAGAEADTGDVGEVVAGPSRSSDAGGGNIRLVGHLAWWPLCLLDRDKLSSGYEIETVAGLGAAADGSEICDDPWAGPQQRLRGSELSLRERLDSRRRVRRLRRHRPGRRAGNTPGRTTLTSATYSVGSHLAYLGDDTVGSDLADAINAGSCTSGGGGDDGDDGSRWAVIIAVGPIRRPQ